MKHIILSSIKLQCLFENLENVDEGQFSDRINDEALDTYKKVAGTVSAKTVVKKRNAARDDVAGQVKNWKKSEPKTYRAARKLSTQKDARHPSEYSARQNKTIKRIEDTASKAAGLK